MNQHLTFSVSMCVYSGDNPVNFDAAINSVVNQTVLPTEIVLVVDGPVPDSIDQVIEKYSAKLDHTVISFKVIRLEKNMGHGEARRICFDNCSQELIALMDADDLSIPERFEKELEYYSKYPETSVVGGYISEFISSKEPTDTSNHAGKRIVPEKDEDIKAFIKKRCPMNQVTVMFRKSDVSEVGGYIDWYCEEDYYLWIRLALAGKIFGNVPEKLVDVRVGNEMYQRRGGWKYFTSEFGIQRLMLKEHMISIFRFILNVSERLLIQVLLPNRIRGWIFQKLARE